VSASAGWYQSTIGADCREPEDEGKEGRRRRDPRKTVTAEITFALPQAFAAAFRPEPTCCGENRDHMRRAEPPKKDSSSGGLKMIRLYDFDLSESCYKIRLLLNILGIKYTKVPVDFVNKEHKNAAYRQLNPFGEIPIFEDEELRLRDTQAILTYIAGKYDGTRRWWPSDPAAQGKIAQWLSVGGNEIMSAAGARLVKILNYDLDLAGLQARAHAAFAILDAHLADRQWLELDHPTIGDIACFPCAALAGEGGISLEPYLNIRRWIRSMRTVPGFTPMPGIAGAA
jgi:glutathione S-transferase